MKDHIEIDGSYGEGGGRNFRDAVMYATIAALNGWRGKLTINNIRMTRPKPGIKNSLFGIVDFCQQILKDVQTTGMEDGSLSATLDFVDVVIADVQEINIDANCLGSAWLLFLAVHPVLLHAPHVETVHICGGTDVFFRRKKSRQQQTLTPPTRYMQEVWLPNINMIPSVNIGFKIHVNIIRNHKDRDRFPYAIRIQKLDDHSSDSIMNVSDIKPWDGCIKTVKSAVSGLQVGTCHPDSQYDLTDPDPKDLCDEHFSDMIIPYICMDPDHPKMKHIVSPHHESVVYIAQLFV